MILKFKNEHIFYALEPVWNNIDFMFKAHVKPIIAANSEKDFEQEIEVSKDILLEIYKGVSRQPEGIAAAINKEIKEELLPQLSAVSNLQEVINDNAVPNEAASILIAINELDLADIAARAALILKGKNNILK